ncbi:ABC transporter permease [Paenibacillus sp. FA6]|uniref:ABC transporter permease n=1 Tax=Paenibacillus sp. FA6 TaxID=3413029 RepID=UPI003F6587E5
MKSFHSYQFASPDSLFWRRLREHFRNQAVLLRSVIDWTVWLYILIPGILLASRLYYDLWVEGLPKWSEALPAGTYLALMLLIIYRSGIILFVQEGDVLFIRMNRRWMSGLMLRGAIYSMMSMLMMMTLTFIIIWPFLVQRLNMNAVEVTCYLIFSMMTGWVVAWIRHIVIVKFKGWRRELLLIPTLGFIGFLYMKVSLIGIHEVRWLLVISILLAFIVILLIRVRLRMQGTFMNDVREDSKRRMVLTNWVLSQAVDQPKPTRTKTWIFRHSPYLYRSRSAERRLAGAAVKALFRNPQDRKLYLQFTAACILAIIFPPVIIKCLVLIAVYIMLTYWHARYWIGFLNDDWIALLPWSSEITSQARVIAIRSMLLPFAVVMSIAFSLSWLGLVWGWLLMIPLAIILYGLTSYILTFLILSRSRNGD